MQDFLIIGGGIAGISAAARLSHLGRVTLLEAEPALGYHASGRSAALFEPRYGLAPVVELSLASEDHHRHAHGGVLSPRGMMIVARQSEAEAFAEDIADMALDQISVDEARGMVPILNPEAVALAGYAAHAEDIDTDLLIQNFLREARGNGATIVTGARVTGIARGAGGWTVTSEAGSHSGRMLVNAAGAWVDGVAQMAGVRPLGFQPNRRSMARIPAPGGHDVSRWPMVFGAGEGWYCKPDAGALIVSPAEEHPMDPHDAWADDMVLAEGLARYEAMVTEPVTRMISNWAGLRTFAPDRVLVIGPDPRVPDFFWLAGQGGYGFQTCPAASQLAADLIAGRAPAVDAATVAALSPARFG
ncbi:FAD-dependent oxidoreductase [Frigidibacter albus]|uniref:FAD-dependent oxidoreductase n=1 Tax=Frigidibacter albus TaxID=1465486 RepID=A0A6L8VG49_9RHOB|nr:FAD-binding oxidoreductase [Frigidibacter albus]MZQ88646.1 FAD-dependent oxidoreductase [Frigidibacter albus]NBE30545.1 FAD-dependent oxidoreductase [Frigidibacter albus]GGH49622.1 glycerol-3-phosphate dehydrogenase [Frigidibacter albus]